MTSQILYRTEQKIPVRIVDQLDGLEEIFDETAEAIIWKRQTPLTTLSALQALPAHEVVNGRFHVSADEVGHRILQLFEEWRWPVSDAHHWLAKDVEDLAGRMVAILSTQRLLLRVELVRTDACRKFHRDTVKARLICTYSGVGTEFGAAENGKGPVHMGNVPTGCPVLLKGKLWPGFIDPLISHRSPPIEALGVSRLVVVLNEAPTTIV